MMLWKAIEGNEGQGENSNRRGAGTGSCYFKCPEKGQSVVNRQFFFFFEEPGLGTFLIGEVLCLWEELGERGASGSTQMPLNSS